MATPQEEGKKWSELFKGYEEEDERERRIPLVIPFGYGGLDRMLGSPAQNPYMGGMHPHPGGYSMGPMPSSTNPMMFGAMPGTTFNIQHTDGQGNQYNLTVRGGGPETFAKAMGAYAVLTGSKDIKNYDAKGGEAGYAALAKAVKGYVSSQGYRGKGGGRGSGPSGGYSSGGGGK